MESYTDIGQTDPIDQNKWNEVSIWFFGVLKSALCGLRTLSPRGELASNSKAKI